MSKEEKLAIAAATDGACSGNPGPGGWGALIRFQDGSETVSYTHLTLPTNREV